jgi:hypothetical protein
LMPQSLCPHIRLDLLRFRYSFLTLLGLCCQWMTGVRLERMGWCMFE